MLKISPRNPNNEIVSHTQLDYITSFSNHAYWEAAAFKRPKTLWCIAGAVDGATAKPSGFDDVFSSPTGHSRPFARKQG